MSTNIFRLGGVVWDVVCRMIPLKSLVAHRDTACFCACTYVNEYKFSSPESCVRVSFDAETSRWVVVSKVIVSKTYLFMCVLHSLQKWA